VTREGKRVVGPAIHAWEHDQLFDRLQDPPFDRILKEVRTFFEVTAPRVPMRAASIWS